MSQIRSASVEQRHTLEKSMRSLILTLIFPFIILSLSQAFAGPSTVAIIDIDIPGIDLAKDKVSLQDYFCQRMAGSQETNLKMNLSKIFPEVFSPKSAESFKSNDMSEACGRGTQEDLQNIWGSCFGESLRQTEAAIMSTCTKAMADQNKSLYFRVANQAWVGIMSKSEVYRRFRPGYQQAANAFKEKAMKSCLPKIVSCAKACEENPSHCGIKDPGKMIEAFDLAISHAEKINHQGLQIYNSFAAIERNGRAEKIEAPVRNGFNSINPGWISARADKIRLNYEMQVYDYHARELMISQRQHFEDKLDPLAMLKGKRPSHFKTMDLEFVLKNLKQENLSGAGKTAASVGEDRVQLIVGEVALIEEYYNRIQILTHWKGLDADAQGAVVNVAHQVANQIGSFKILFSEDNPGFVDDYESELLDKEYIQGRIASLSTTEFEEMLKMLNQRTEPIFAPRIKRAILSSFKNRLKAILEVGNGSKDEAEKSSLAAQLVYSTGAFIGDFEALEKWLNKEEKYSKGTSKVVTGIKELLSQVKTSPMDHFAVFHILTGKEAANYYAVLGNKIKRYTWSHGFGSVPSEGFSQLISIEHAHPITQLGFMCGQVIAAWKLGPHALNVALAGCGIEVGLDQAQYWGGRYIEEKYSALAPKYTAAVAARLKLSDGYYAVGAQLLKSFEAGDANSFSSNAVVKGYDRVEQTAPVAAFATKFSAMKIPKAYELYEVTKYLVVKAISSSTSLVKYVAARESVQRIAKISYVYALKNMRSMLAATARLVPMLRYIRVK